MMKLEIPYGVSLHTLKEIIAGLYRAQAHIQSVELGEISRTVRYKTRTIQRQVGFLRQIGVIELEHWESSVYYKLTKTGRDLARSADYGQDDRFYKAMRELLLAWGELAPALEYIVEAPDVDREGLLNRILMHSKRTTGDKSVNMGANVLITLLVKTDIIRFEDHRVIAAESFLQALSGQVDSRQDESETQAHANEASETAPDDKKPDSIVAFSSLRVKNIRSVVDARIPLKRLNILVGNNASGKSSIVHSLLALRNLQWGRTFANSSYREMEWLRRRGTNEPMIVNLEGKVTSSEHSCDINLLVAFTPSLSYCTQLCILQEDSWICDTSFFSEKGDLLVPYDMLMGLREVKELSDNVREGLERLSEYLETLVDSDKKEPDPSYEQKLKVMFSIMEDNEGGREENYSPRRLLGAWPGALPEFLREPSKDSLRGAYLAARPALRYGLDSIEFVPVIRGFLSLHYPQKDDPPARLSDDLDFVSQLLNKMIFPDELDEDALNRMKHWANEFGIEGFETVLQPGRKVEARGWLGEFKLPVALYGFGSNQFLALAGKCLFALMGAPVIIEEPEIHLHPQLQALATDFLIEIMENDHQLFITTHSEHLLGRIQRRMAEGRISPEDVAVLWVRLDSEKDGSIVEEVKMDDRGVFHDGLRAYLGFLQEELKSTEQARHSKKKQKSGAGSR